LFGGINKNLKPYTPKVFLAKPDKTIIAKLSEAFDRNIIYNYGSINEFSCKIPYVIMKNHKSVRNAHVDLIRGHFLLKVDDEWFKIIQPKKIASGGKEFLEVFAKALPIELGSKRVAIYNPVDVDGISIGKNATEVLTDCLENTLWTVEYVDADFDVLVRHFNVSEITKLDFLNQIAETFNGILQYDTENYTVSLYKNESLGQDKGLTIKYGKYLKEIEEEPNFDEVCTRLYVYGKDGLTFNSVNASGTNYIENFSYYMYPYNETITNEENDIYIVNKHSNYMSDGLCHSIIKYNKLLQEKETEFNNLLSQNVTKQGELVTLENELFILENELQIILDSLLYWQSSHDGESNTELINQRNSKQTEVNNKKSEITSKNSEITNIYSQISVLRDEISIENNFTSQQIEERERFIFEKKWSSDYIYDERELYNRAKDELIKIAQPQISYSIDIVDFLKVVECQYDWDKLVYGDIITVKYDNFDVNIKAKIISIEHNYDDNKITLTIANDKDIKNGWIKILDMITNGNSASTSVDLNKYKWENGNKALGTINAYIDSAFDANKQAIIAGINENYTLDRFGLTLKDPNDPNNFLKALHNVIAFTNDGGNSYKHAVTPTGIVGEHIWGKIIAGVNLTIENSGGTFLVNGEGVTLTNMNLNMTRSDNKARIIANTTDGFKIQGNSGSGFVDKLWFDTNGNGVMDGILKAKDIELGGISILNTAKNLIKDAGIESLTASKITAGTIEATISIIAPTITGGTLQTASSGKRIRIASNQLNSLNGNTKEGFCIEQYTSGSYTTYNALLYRGGVILGGLLDFNGQELWLYSNANLGTYGQNLIVSGGRSLILKSGDFGLVCVGDDIADNRVVVASEIEGFLTSGDVYSKSYIDSNFASISHTHGNSYVKTGGSQNLKLQAFEGAETNYVEVYLGSTYLGKVDLIL
jgi:hypothetical protein